MAFRSACFSHCPIELESLTRILFLQKYWCTIVLYYKNLHDVRYFSSPAYPGQLSVNKISNALNTVPSLLDSGGGPNSVNYEFLPWWWEWSTKPSQLLALQRENWEVVNVEGLFAPFLCTRDSCIRTECGAIETSPVCMMPRTLFNTLRRILLTEGKVAPFLLRPDVELGRT